MDSLPLDDVRAIVRLLGDASDPALPGDVASLRRRLLTGLAQLVGADVWVWAQSRREPGTGRQSYFSYIDGGWDSDRQREIALTTEHSPEQVEIERQIVARSVNHMTCTRADLIGDAAWYASPIYHKFRVPADLDDMIFSYYPVGPDVISGIGLHRKLGKPAFSDRERCIVHVVTGEIDWLHRAGSDVPAATQVTGLSPRLRQVLLFLLAGHSRKQVAGVLGISEHTVADYVKALHRHFDVNSRGELLARFITGGKAARPANDAVPHLAAAKRGVDAG